jgi:hypothetical protein
MVAESGGGAPPARADVQRLAARTSTAPAATVAAARLALRLPSSGMGVLLDGVVAKAAVHPANADVRRKVAALGFSSYL